MRWPLFGGLLGAVVAVSTNRRMRSQFRTRVLLALAGRSSVVINTELHGGTIVISGPSAFVANLHRVEAEA